MLPALHKMLSAILSPMLDKKIMGPEALCRYLLTLCRTAASHKPQPNMHVDVVDLLPYRSAVSFDVATRRRAHARE